jgi:hypothetical protein
MATVVPRVVGAAVRTFRRGPRADPVSALILIDRLGQFEAVTRSDWRLVPAGGSY